MIGKRSRNSSQTILLDEPQRKRLCLDSRARPWDGIRSIRVTAVDPRCIATHNPRTPIATSTQTLDSAPTASPISSPKSVPKSAPTPAYSPARPAFSDSDATPQPVCLPWDELPAETRAYLPWDELPAETRARLSAQYEDLIARIWSGKREFVSIDSFMSIAQALGLSSTEEPDGITTFDLLRKHPGLCRATIRARMKQNFYDFCNHRECIFLVVLAVS